MKNMLSQEDISQVRVIVREEIDVSPKIQNIAIALGNLQVEHQEVKETLGNVERVVNKILSIMDAFVKKNSDLEIEQKSHAAELSRHEAWIQKANKKLKISH